MEVSIPNRCPGRIPCLFQVHFFLAVPHTYSGLLIWSLHPGERMANLNFHLYLKCFFLLTLTRMEVA